MKKDEGVIVREVFKVYRDGTIYRKTDDEWKKAKFYKFKPTKRLQERYQVSTHYKGKQYVAGVSRLLAEAFIPNPENKSMVFHIDGNPLNNDLDNLAWVTASERLRNVYKQGGGYTLENNGHPCIECGEKTLAKDGVCTNCKKLYEKEEALIEHKRNSLSRFSEVDYSDLNDVEEIIVNMRKEGSTLAEVGHELGVTKERVRQYEEKILTQVMAKKIVKESFGKKILTIHDVVELREKVGIKKSKLARFISLDPTNYINKENKPQNFTIKQIIKISNFFGVKFEIYQKRDNENE